MNGKYSCGEINHKAQYLSNEGYITNIILMFFGVFLLIFGGVRFKTMMLIIAGVLFFMIIVLFLMSIFNI